MGKSTLREVIHESRKRERRNEDGLFMIHQKGSITTTFTVDWFLREGDGRESLGEWIKSTSVRSPDQRRNVAGEFTHVPVQRLDPQDYEGKGIR